MSEHRELIDAFAEVRRTWDDLVALQPDIVAASGTLSADDVAEFARRVDSHRASVDLLADALDTTLLDPIETAPDSSSG